MKNVLYLIATTALLGCGHDDKDIVFASSIDIDQSYLESKYYCDVECGDSSTNIDDCYLATLADAIIIAAPTKVGSPHMRTCDDDLPYSSNFQYIDITVSRSFSNTFKDLESYSITSSRPGNWQEGQYYLFVLRQDENEWFIYDSIEVDINPDNVQEVIEYEGSYYKIKLPSDLDKLRQEYISARENPSQCTHQPQRLSDEEFHRLVREQPSKCD
jgi:hypothetical protein